MDNKLKILLPFFLVNLITRMFLLNWNGAEYTDSIFMMSADHFGKAKWLPFYPLLMQLVNFIFNDIELSGKIVSSLSASLAIFPLFFIVDRIWGRKIGVYILLLYSCSAIIMRWSLHVMTEAPFMLLFLLSTWCLLEFITDMNKSYLRMATLFAALGAITRPEGIIMLPVLFALYAWQFHKRGWREFASTIWIGISWALLPLWHILVVGNFLYGNELKGGASDLTLYKLLTYFFSYLDIAPYTVGYPLFVLAIIGIIHAIDNKKISHVLLFCYFILGWISVLPVHAAWSTRFLYPLVPLFLVFAAGGLAFIESKFNPQWAKKTVMVCMVYSVIFSGAVLVFQRDSYGDIKRSALYLKNNLQQEVVYSDELTKTIFWSNKKVKKYGPNRNNIKAGEYVVLHSFLTDLQKELSYISQNHQSRIVYSTESLIIPLLADDIVPPLQSAVTNRPAIQLYRFTPQKFKSVIVELY